MTTVAQTQPLSASNSYPVRSVNFQCVVVIGLVVLISGALVFAHLSGLLRPLFPALAFFAAVFLFWRSKPCYVGFVCWLWFLTPWLRRIVDFNIGYDLPATMLLAPYLAAAVSAITVFAQLSELGKRRMLPFACAFSGVLYGIVIGLMRFNLKVVVPASLTWLVPIFFGYFLCYHRELYPQFRSVLEKSFLYGVLVMGIYGTYQFFHMPQWDRYWLDCMECNAFGWPGYDEVRVFSTMNAPQVFAGVMVAGLLILYSLHGGLRLVAAAFGILSLILTSARASWLGLIAGLFYLSLRLNSRLRFRLFSGIVASVIVICVAAQAPVINGVFSARVRSLTNPSHDISYTARVYGHAQAFQGIASKPYGGGVGSPDQDHSVDGKDERIGPHDSTMLEFFYSLGWVGTFAYLVGLMILAARIFNRKMNSDSFTIASKAILVAFVAESMLNTVMIGVLGFVVWTVAAMCLAAAQNQREAAMVA